MSRESESGIRAITIAVGALLMIVPAPAALEPLRPYWVGLIMIYWSMEAPEPIRLGTTFFIGLLVDLLTASLMGMHGLSLVVLVYLVRRFRARIRFFPAWQQALAVFALLVNDRIILLWITLLLGEPRPTWQYWLAPLVGMALWPWLFLLIDYLRARRRASAHD